MAFIAVVVLVDVRGPNLALVSVALVAIELVIGSSNRGAVANVAGLAERALLGARLRIVALTALVGRICHALVRTIAAGCARRARSASLGAVCRVCTSSREGTRGAGNRLRHLRQAVHACWAGIAIA